MRRVIDIDTHRLIVSTDKLQHRHCLVGGTIRVRPLRPSSIHEQVTIDVEIGAGRSETYPGSLGGGVTSTLAAPAAKL